MVTTRFAPSPTGDLHIGGVRTALYSWLYAKQHRGQFKLRIEDTDRERSSQSSVDVILNGMSWLGLDHQGSIIYQSQRFDLYNQIIDKMISDGQAYYCWCTPEELELMRETQIKNGEKPRYNGKYRNGGEPVDGVTPVVRFKNPLEGSVSWNDHVRGNIRVENKELDDMIIRRSDGSPTYNFCVVVDDAEQAVTLVIRGDDHISNTPRQINIYQALGYKVPEFAHVPMILGDDGKRLSKRHGATNVMDYKNEGYLPEAIINYLIRLGWSHGDQEIFSSDELLEYFKITDVHSAPSTFNTEKLRWLNQQYIQKTDIGRLAQLLPHFQKAQGYEMNDTLIKKTIPYYQDRAKTLKEMATHMMWIAKAPEIFPEKQAKKAFKGQETIRILTDLTTRISALEQYTQETVHQCFEETVAQLEIGFGKLGQPARLSLTGGAPSPDLALCFDFVGKESAIARLKAAISFIENNTEK